MGLFEAIISGFVQGVTEFLPISSSGHLIIIHDFFGLEIESLSFDVAVHIATLGAVIWALREDVLDVLKVVFSKKLFSSLGLKIVVATIPAGIVGFMLSDNTLELLRTTQVVAISLIFWGIILFFADFFVIRRRHLITKIEKISWLRAVIIGLAQAIALIPGTSRSGITMTAGMFTSIDRERAARFSFLLSIPAIMGAGLLSTIDAVESGLDVSIVALVIGCIVAFVSGMFAIKFLLKYLKKGSFFWFCVYRVILGVILLIAF